jgi:hypothetical protein
MILYARNQVQVYWHVYVLAGTYFIWPWAPYRIIRDVTPGPLSATDTYIAYHVTHFETSPNVILHTRYVSTYVGAGCERGRGTKKTKAIRCGACYYSIVFTRLGCTLLTCDMYMSDLRHIHDPVHSSLKMEVISLLFLQVNVCLLLARPPPVGQGPLIHEVSRSQTTTHHSR